MSREENKAVIRRLFDEVYNGSDVDVLDELVAEDVVNHAADDEHKHGIEDFRHVVEWTYAPAPEACSELIDMIAEGEKVACRVRVSGTQEGEIFGIPPTGKSFTAEYAYWHYVVGGGLGGEGRPWYPDPVGHHLPAGKVDGREPSLEGSCIPGA